MKIVKKLLTSFCALAIAATAMSSFAIMASAEGEVTAVPVITVDEEAKTVDIAMHVKNVPASVDGSAQYVTYAVVGIDVSSFSTVDLSTLGEDDYFDWEDAHFSNAFSTGSPIVGIDSTAPGYFAYQLKFDTGTLARTAGADVVDDIVLFNLNDIPLSDDALANGFEVKLRGIDNALGFAIGTAKRGNYNNTSLYKCNTSVAGAPTAVLETATWAPEGGEEDDNKVAFEGFTGTKEDGETPDGSVAVATSTTFTTKADAPSQINWTVTLKNGAGVGTYSSTVDTTGGAEFTLGMVINGLAAELVETIEAVLAQ